MKTLERIKTVFLYGIFISYIFLLVKILLLSRFSLLEVFSSQRTVSRSINLIPFNSIMEYISGSTDNLRRFAFGNVAGNIAIFIPLGIYLPLLKKDKRILKNLSYIFIASLLVEIIQGLLGIGVSDVDDIILNSFGGLIGVLGYKLLLLLLRDEKKVSTVITILSGIIGLPIILYLLFMVRMKF
ncbi:hypothetical protein CSC2_41380 [Clostridium zeae]|uniref:VanZ-like domain-containing protein n=1 Tax=Clostridium zeae TaxID=2759022 RepID=A0ABQ1EFQ8_9CLOT|nr:VanZ family protein [Clostridium zeae]GFZ33612.1 hypothetical protein CSC2_41380 [Clostridium zeae]